MRTEVAQVQVQSFARAAWESGERDHGEVARQYLRAALTSDDPEGALYPLVTAAMSEQFRRYRKALEHAVGSWEPRRPGEQGALPLSPVRPEDSSRADVQRSSDSQRGIGASPAAPKTAPPAPKTKAEANGSTESGGAKAGRGAHRGGDSQSTGGTPATPAEQRAELLNQDVWIVSESGGERGRMVRWIDVTLEDIERTVTYYRGLIGGMASKIALLESARAQMIRHQVSRLGDVPRDALLDTLPAGKAA